MSQLKSYDLKSLKRCEISHAEIEYLWDTKKGKRGAIDPNALSAGGFPVVFRTVLEHVDVSESIKSSEYRGMVLQAIKESFPLLEKKLSEELAETNVQALEKMGIVDRELIEIYSKQLKIVSPHLNQLYRNEYFSRLKALLSTEYGISWVYPKLWQVYRTKKIEKVIDLEARGKSIGPFSYNSMKEIVDYLDHLLKTLLPIPQKRYVMFDVEWESDTSYYIAYKLQLLGIHAEVFSDLHSNCGIFAEIPLRALLAPYGKSGYREVYKLLVSQGNSDSSSKREVSYSNGKSVVKYTHNKGVEIELPNKVNVLIMAKCKAANTFQEHSFKQYAYLWEWFPKDAFHFDVYDQRKMYYSSLFNAKSCFFEVLNFGERKYSILIQKPKTVILSQKELSQIDLPTLEITIKDGGWCSTGGKHVHRVKSKDLEKIVKEVKYSGYVIQENTPSVLFTKRGNKNMHGHVRKTSIIDKEGNVVHAGFVFKLVEESRGNSSGFLSYVLYYNESCEFVFAKEVGTETRIFYSLKEAELVPLYNLEKLLKEVRNEWEKCMYVLNKFVSEEDVPTFVARLVKDGKLSKRYLIN